MENESNFLLGGAIIPLVGPGASCGYLKPRQLKDPGMDPPPQLRVCSFKRVGVIELDTLTELWGPFWKRTMLYNTHT